LRNQVHFEHTCGDQAFDLTHDYTLPILAGVAANIIAAAIVALMFRIAPATSGN